MASERQPMQPHGLVELWTTVSSSRPSIRHITTRDAAGVVDCTCEGKKHHGTCWHIDQVYGEAGEDPEGDFQVSL